MRGALLAGFWSLGMTMHATQERLYLGTSTFHTASEGIYTTLLDAETGAIGPVSLAVRTKNPSFLAISPDGKTLYSTMEEDGGAVGAFSIQPDGILAPLNDMPSGGASACHVWVTSDGRHVLVANYRGGNISCFSLRPDGSLGERTAFWQFQGSGPDPKRQTQSFAHGIYTDAENRFAYICDLGSDQVWSFRFNTGDGSLQPTAPSSGAVPPGSGPRHLALHPNGLFAYANNEMGLSVTAFSRDPETGTLTPLQTLPTTSSSGPREGVTTSEIACHPNAKWLYVSSRGDDIIAVYRIEDGGRLALIDNTPAGVQVPRGMAIDPTGKWLVVAGQKDSKLTVLKIDLITGKLAATGHSETAPAPICVTFVPGPR